MPSRYAADYVTAEALEAAFDSDGLNADRVACRTAYGPTLPEAVAEAMHLDVHGEAYRLRREVLRRGTWETTETYRFGEG